MHSISTRRAGWVLASSLLMSTPLTSMSTMLTSTALAQAAPHAVTGPTSYADFLERVGQSNVDLLASRAGVAQADARINIARVFPSPRLSGGVSTVDISGNAAPTMTLLQIDVPVDLSDRIGHRTAFATAEALAARADFDAQAWMLRADAGRAWIAALRASLVLARTQRTLATLERLVQVNQERLAAGSVGEVQLFQSRVEAERYRGRALQADAELRAVQMALSQFIGSTTQESPITPTGALDVAAHDFDADALVEVALAQRPDVHAVDLARDAASRGRELASANRMVDLVLSVNWQHAFPSIGTPFNTPDYDTLGVLASVELPTRLLLRGELDEADARIDEQMLRAQSTRLQVDIEVRSTLARYQAARDRLALYRGTILSDADHVLEAVLYTYERGGGSLLEVLLAQRTADEVYLDYYDALSEHAALLVDLERVTGQAQITF